MGKLKNILPKNLLSWTREFYFIVTSKAFIANDAGPDIGEIFDCEAKPDWLKLDTLYMFAYENDEDTSDFRKCYPAHEILCLERIEHQEFKGDYVFAIELKEKVYLCSVEYLKDEIKWQEALMKAKKALLEAPRTKYNLLKVDVDPLFFQYETLKVKEAGIQQGRQACQKSFLETEVSTLSESQAFISRLKRSIQYLEDVPLS